MIRRPPRSTLGTGRRQRQMCIRDRSRNTAYSFQTSGPKKKYNNGKSYLKNKAKEEGKTKERIGTDRKK